MGVLSDRGRRGGDVAACTLGGPRLDERGGDVRAETDRERAAADEAAAVGRVDRRRGDALAQLDLRPVGTRGIRYGVEQQTGVRVQRLREHALRRPLLDD